MNSNTISRTPSCFPAGKVSGGGRARQKPRTSASSGPRKACAIAESESEWVVKLYTTFEDRKSLYLLMEYLLDGDLMFVLRRLENFELLVHCKAHAAAIVRGIEAIHKLEYIHRDIKPNKLFP